MRVATQMHVKDWRFPTDFITSSFIVLSSSSVNHAQCAAVPSGVSMRSGRGSFGAQGVSMQKGQEHVEATAMFWYKSGGGPFSRLWYTHTHTHTSLGSDA